MPRTVTTLSVHPDRADQLRKIKRDRDLASMDAALDHVLEEVNAGA